MIATLRRSINPAAPFPASMDWSAPATVAAGVLGAAGAVAAALIATRHSRRTRDGPVVHEPVPGYEEVSRDRVGPAVATVELASLKPPFRLRVSIRDGNYQEFPIELRKGERLEGTLVETRGQPFDCLILDQASYVRFHRDEEHASGYEGRGSSGYDLRWRCPRSGRWFLVVDVQRVDAPREIEFNVAKRSRWSLAGR